MSAVAVESLELETACALARRLAAEAVWHDGRCTWLGDDVGADGEVVHRALPADLYAGTAGIAWFLAHLAAATGDRDAGRTAEGALGHALARADREPDRGLYTGRTGVALAAVLAGAALGSDELVERGAALGRAAAAAPPAGELDLVAGEAGVAVGLLRLGDALDDDTLRAAAVGAGERLVLGNRPTLCGLAHGASGVALALLELQAATGDDRFGTGADALLAFERSRFSRAHGNWPDLRELALGAGSPPYPVFWCHGAAGIGLARLRAYELRGDPTALAEAAAAIDTATATMLRAVAAGRRSAGPDLSLCHGVGSVVELHAYAAEVTGDREHLEHARRLARWGVWGREACDRADLPAVLSCGIPGGGETAGLMLGLGGIGAAFLRAHDPAALPSPLLPSLWRRTS